MFENLRKLYRHYGSLLTVVKSSYFWLALFFAALSYASIWTREWADFAVAVMPSLAGFTLASFAIIFAIVDADMLRRLTFVGEGGTSPMVSVAAAIAHAVLVQVLAVLMALSFGMVDADSIEQALVWVADAVGWASFPAERVVEISADVLSGLGLFVTYYGVVLVIAAVFSIFRMQLIVAEAKKNN